MKSILLILSILMTTPSFADLGERFCEEKATAYFEGYHQRVLDEIGVIQGYFETVDMEYTQVKNQIDQRDETYHFYVRAENDEGEYWVWEYQVFVEAWLEAGGKAHTCTVQPMNFLGVTEEYPNE